ncbi:MAG: copper resistance protein CopC [Chloroflexota bacterium]|nr:copper resistance protein CopC [Chloroflexota bacterium]
MTWIRIGLIVVGAALAAAPLAGTASAHARLKSSTPAVGEVVQASPARLEVVFTENVQKVSGTYGLEVQTDGGSSVTAGSTVIDESDRSHMSVALQPNLAPGRYVVNWKNVSDDDGDPANGAFSFYIQTPPTAADLQKDQELAAIGAEDLTATAGTASAETPTSSAATVASGSTGAATSPSATSIAPSSTPSGSSNTSRNVIIIVASVIAIVAIGGGVAYAVRDRMRP